jgi:hypothetical protein
MAVALNGLVMMVGFGSLMVASHRGIWSLGLVLTIGSAVTSWRPSSSCQCSSNC